MPLNLRRLRKLISSSVAVPLRLNGPGWPGTGGGNWARRRMMPIGIEKN